MAYFPVFLDITARACLVAGGGRVGQRKIHTLARCGAGRIVVLDPRPDKERLMEATGESVSRLEIYRVPFSPEHVRGMSLVFACTPDSRENERIARICAEKGVFCNVATSEGGDMILPALLSRGDLQIAVSTAGGSPALCRRVREKLDRELGPEYARLAGLLRRLREPILSLGLEQEENAAYFRRLTEDDVLQALRSGDREEMVRVLEKVLPAALKPEIGELVHALV